MTKRDVDGLNVKYISLCRVIVPFMLVSSYTGGLAFR